MIKYANTLINGMYTEGFGVTITEPFSIRFDKGAMYVKKKVTIDTDISTEETTKIIYEKETYPMFEFDIEVNSRFPAVYDVYLIKGDTEEERVQVDRTEIYGGIVPTYTGEAELVHTLSSFTVYPGTQSLSEVDIKINTFVEREVGEDGNENINQ